MQLNTFVPPNLRGLCSAMSLRWSDLSIATEEGRVDIDKRVFYNGFWNGQPVTLCVMRQIHQTCAISRAKPVHFKPISEFHDLVPANLLADGLADDQTLVQCK